MLLDAGEKFLLRQAINKGPTNLYLRYLAIEEKTGKRVSDISVGYLEAFLQYRPHECIRTIRQHSAEFLTLAPYDKEYILLLHSLAEYYLQRKEVVKALLWTMKSGDMFGYFYPTWDKDKWEDIFLEMPGGKILAAHVWDYEIEALHTNQMFSLSWERSVIDLYANDN